jgi:hypothetical protein
VVEIRRPEAHRRDRQLARVVLGHGDDLGVRGDVEDLAQELEALRGDGGLLGRAQVKEHHVRFGAPHQREGLLGGLRGGHVEVGEHRLELAAQRLVVLQDE